MVTFVLKIVVMCLLKCCDFIYRLARSDSTRQQIISSTHLETRRFGRSDPCASSSSCSENRIPRIKPPQTGENSVYFSIFYGNYQITVRNTNGLDIKYLEVDVVRTRDAVSFVS